MKSKHRRQPLRLLLRRGTAFVVAAGLLAYLAFEGASYDVVPRQSVALLVWAAIAGGLALGAFPRGRIRAAALVPLGATFGLLAWMVLGLAWTDSAERTTIEIGRLVCFGGFITLALIALNRHTFRAAAAGLSIAGVAVTAVAVFSRLSPSTFPQALDVVGAFSQTDRLTFPLDYWNAVGAWAAMSAAACLAWSAHARLPVVRAAALSAVPVAALAVYLSYSRAGIIASAVAAVAAIALSRNRWTAFVHVLAALGGSALVILVARGHEEIARATGSAGAGTVALALVGAALICCGAVLLTSVLRADTARLPRRTAAWVVPVTGAVLLVAILALGRGPISDAWHEFETQDHPASTTQDPSARLTTAGGNRSNYWSSAIDAFESDPVKGTGAGTFEFWWERKSDNDEYVRDAHSVYLEAMAEMGLPGLLLLLAMLGGLLGAALAARRTLTRGNDIGASAAMCSVFVVFLVAAGVDWQWEETAVAAFALAGGAVAIAAGSARLRSDERRGALGRPGVRALAVAGAILLAVVEVPALVSAEKVRASKDALTAGDIDAARTNAKAAITAEPWAATPHQQLASVEQAAGNLNVARSEIEIAIDKEPLNWQWPLILAPIQAQQGDRAAAIRTFRRGSELAPKLPFYAPISAYGQQVYSRAQLLRIVQRQQARAAQAEGEG